MSQHYTPSQSLCNACDDLTDAHGTPGHFIMCPIHAAAPELFAALQAALPVLERAATEEARGNKAPTGLPPRTGARARWNTTRALLAKVNAS